MKMDFRLMAVTITLMCASLAGCFGDDDSGSGGYDGPIDLVVFYDSTSGMIEGTVNNGQNGPLNGVELSFDFADTTSDDGDITKITLDPDDGSDPVEGNPSEDAVLSYTWLTHGVFEITLSAEDEDGNSHSIEVSVRIDMHIVWTETNTDSSTMSINTTPDCEDGEPNPYTVTVDTTVQDTGTLFSAGSEVQWVFNDPEGEEIASDTGSMANGQSQSFEHVAKDIVAGNYEIKVDVIEDDNVNVENDVTVAYEEGTEDSPNPRDE